MKPFDRVHRQYNRFMEKNGLFRSDEILDILQLKKYEILLDVGGGTGVVASYLADHAAEVLVLEESRGMLSHLPEKPNLQSLEVDALASGLPDGYAHKILLSDVFHHIKDQHKLLQEMHRLLKPGGVLLIHDFDLSHRKTRQLRFFEFFLFGPLWFHDLDWYKKNCSHYFRMAELREEGFYFLMKLEKGTEDS